MCHSHNIMTGKHGSGRVKIYTQVGLFPGPNSAGFLMPSVQRLAGFPNRVSSRWIEQYVPIRGQVDYSTASTFCSAIFSSDTSG